MDKVLSEIKLPPYILNVRNHGQKNIDRQLGSLIGKTVCVSYTTVTNDNGEMALGSRQHLNLKFLFKQLLKAMRRQESIAY